MKHIIISDTHAPDCINKAFNYIKESRLNEAVDAIVINGDLLGTFSIDKSNRYRQTGVSNSERLRHLKEAAPKFYENFIKTKKITKDSIISFVKERYDWCYNTIKQFSELNFTIFNLGNHESEYHFLVLHDLPFLTGCDYNLINQVNQQDLIKISKDFENKLLNLEKEGRFKYIRYGHFIKDQTMIIGIPGINHSTEGFDDLSHLQEQETKKILENTKKDLKKVTQVIIYNHTQGKYNREFGSFTSASKALNEYMKNLPFNVLNQIFIQSHNHWSHAQFILIDGFNILLNNAGLHDGIFNVLDFNLKEIKCYDADPNTKKLIKMKCSTNFSKVKDDIDLISRFYEDPKPIQDRRNK